MRMRRRLAAWSSTSSTEYGLRWWESEGALSAAAEADPEMGEEEDEEVGGGGKICVAEVETETGG